MDREQILSKLREHADELRQRGVTHLDLFGSVARGEATERSDVDLMAAFQPHLGIIKIGSIQYRLEKILGSPVDLSDMEWLKPAVSQSARRDAVNVF